MTDTKTLDDGGTPGGGGQRVAPHDGELARVPIIGGYTVLLDAADTDLIAGYPWRALHGHNGRVYAYAKTPEHGYYMHRLIAQTPKGMETDHINGDGLDNRRANLRVATLSQNSANTGKPRRTDGQAHTSRFKGVSWSAERNKWVACIQVARQTRTLGRFDNEEEAARVYDEAAFAVWGDFARLNFEVAS